MGLSSDRKKPTAGTIGLALLLSLTWVVVSAGYPSAPVTAQSASVPLSLDPPSLSLARGEVASVDIIVDAGNQPIDTVQVFLDFDPSLLQVVNATGNPVSSIEFGPIINDQWKQELLNEVDNGAGRIGVAAGKGHTATGGVDANSRFVLATVHLTPLVDAANTSIAFDMEESLSPQRTKAYHQGSEVTGPGNGVAVTISPSNSTASVPLTRGGGGGGSGGGYIPPAPYSGGPIVVVPPQSPTPVLGAVQQAAPSSPPESEDRTGLVAPLPTVETQITSPEPEVAPVEKPVSAGEDQESVPADTSSNEISGQADVEGGAFGSIVLLLIIGVGLVGILGTVIFTNDRIKEFLLGTQGPH